MNEYAEVILPLPLEGTFTYAIPTDIPVEPGSRVIVSFGKKKIYTGIVHSIHQELTEAFKPKPILEVLDEKPVINGHQLRFFEWMARYYMCTLGEVMNAALPAALKLSSESFVSLSPAIDPDDHNLEDREWHLLTDLQQGDLSIKNIGERLGLKNPHRIIKSLSERGYIVLYLII